MLETVPGIPSQQSYNSVVKMENKENNMDMIIILDLPGQRRPRGGFRHMGPCNFKYGLGTLMIAAAAAAAPAIDLRGKVVAAAGGEPVAGALVSLLAAGVSDTTDADGVFHIVADRVAIRRPDAGPLGPIAGWNAGRSLEVFDMSGRLIAGTGEYGSSTADPKLRTDAQSAPPVKAVRIGIIDHTPLYAELPSLRPSGNTATATRATALSKAAAAADTLLVARAGFLALKAPVPEYVMEIGTLRLEPGSAEFTIRKPTERSFTCGASTTTALDKDLVCDIENDALKASIYFQSKPVGCVGLGGETYAVENAWIKTDAGIEPLAEASYDGGGNHQNDRLGFAWKGKYFSLYHSSIGFGFRSCAAPDCMDVCTDVECRTVLRNGCGRSACAAQPALKTRCAVVQADGTVPERIDPWSPLQTPHLPCGGDPLCR
jgi:hypothetical protein